MRSIDSMSSAQQAERLGDKELYENLNLEWGETLRGNHISAVEEAERLNKSLGKGEKRWRLPTKDELQTVADSFTIDKDAPGFRDLGEYWTSTPGKKEGWFAIVQMYSGASEEEPEYAMSALFRLVREK